MQKYTYVNHNSVLSFLRCQTIKSMKFKIFNVVNVQLMPISLTGSLASSVGYWNRTKAITFSEKHLL